MYKNPHWISDGNEAAQTEERRTRAVILMKDIRGTSRKEATNAAIIMGHCEDCSFVIAVKLREEMVWF